jgi:hypothetical protein
LEKNKEAEKRKDKVKKIWLIRKEDEGNSDKDNINTLSP